MRFLSVCSGIEAASVAWNPLGWHAAAFAEIEPFPCSLLAHHYPDVPNRGDMTKFEEWPLEPINLLCGGTPCQSYSIAGLRKGLADPRGNLMLTYGAIAARYRPKWLVWENVPGVLSSNGGRDFGTFLGMLGQLGYGFAYRVLDAQFFGLAQRRQRVFVVGCLGDWRGAAAVLFERHSLQGHPAPSREQGPRTTVGTLGGTSPGGGWRVGADEAAAGQLVATLDASYGRLQGCSGQDANHGHSHLVPVAFNWQGGGTQTTLGYDPQSGITGSLHVGQTPAIAFDTTQITSRENRSNPQPGDPCHPLAAGAHAPAIAFKSGQSEAAGGTFVTEEYAPTLQAQNNGSTAVPSVMAAMQVRRLTPRECERLQGFPDDYTLIPITKRQPVKGQPAVVKWAADGPRYKALGNSWAVPCARWIGQRINQVEALHSQREEIAA